MTATSLPLRDTPQLYGLISRILHWGIAVLILSQFLGMGLRLLLGRTPVVSFFVSLHQPVGTLLMILIVLRAIWALTNRRNRPSHGHGVVGMAARLGHMALYGLMFLVPFVALLRAYGGERGFAPFGFPIFPPREEPIGWMVWLAQNLHSELGWTMAVLIAGHVLMVAVHQGMWRDGTLQKMAGRRA